MPTPISEVRALLDSADASEATDAVLAFLEDEIDIRLKRSITGLTGGGATNLDGIPTVGLGVGLVQIVMLGGEFFFYKLDPSGEPEATPQRIRPDDFNGSTNAKTWALISIRADNLSSVSIGSQSLTISNELGNFAQILPDLLTGERAQSFADADGTIPAVPSYADLTAANAALTSGEFFWDTTLKKLRVATA